DFGVLRHGLRSLGRDEHLRRAGPGDLHGLHFFPFASSRCAAHARSTLPPERTPPPCLPLASIFFSSSAQAASAPVGSRTPFMRSNRKIIALRSSSSVAVIMSATYFMTSGKVSLPSEGVGCPSAIVSGLCTVCSVLVWNERVASSPVAGSTQTTRHLELR